MKKLFTLLLATILMFSLCACGAGTGANGGFETEPEPTEPASVLENDDLKVDGVFVDTSYADGNNAALKLVYVMLTINPTKNVDVDSQYTKMNIGENEYESTFYKNRCIYMPSYYYASYIEEVLVGTELKLALTFEVPEADLAPGKTVTLSDTSIPLQDIKFTTDEIVSCTSAQQIGETVDAAACAQVVYDMQPADQATVQRVSNNINGYYYSFYVSVGTSVMAYELEFSAPNRFVLYTSNSSNGGTYEVLNGYILLNYSTNSETVIVKYEFDGGDVSMYCADAFSIYE